MFNRLLAEIPGHWPKAGVIGILLWCVTFALIVPAIIFGVLHWHTALVMVLILMFLLVICFMVCVLWLMTEHIFGRVTPWRQ
jgi:hypothetical protein